MKSSIGEKPELSYTVTVPRNGHVEIRFRVRAMPGGKLDTNAWPAPNRNRHGYSNHQFEIKARSQVRRGSALTFCPKNEVSDYPESDWPYTFYFNGQEFPKWSAQWHLCALGDFLNDFEDDWDEFIGYRPGRAFFCRHIQWNY
ncbi:MAG: hypothetical protein AAGD22_16595 [Verrucomicrobiota bacterium]